MTIPTAPSPGLGEREAVARTLDPYAWECWEEIQQPHYGSYGLSGEPEGRLEDSTCARWQHAVRGAGMLAKSLAKADAIIAQHIEPLRTENETLGAERDTLKTALDEMRATIDPTIDLIQRQKTWQVYGERLEREADAALADEIQTQRKRVVEMKAQVKAAEAERDAAIARAEEAERRHMCRLETAPVGTLAPSIGGGRWYRNERGWKWNGPEGTGSTFPRPGADWTGELLSPDEESEVIRLTAKLAQAEGEIATMRAVFNKVDEHISLALISAGKLDKRNDSDFAQGFAGGIEDMASEIREITGPLTNPEHPHGD